MRQKILLLAALAFGVIAFILVYTELQNQKNKLKARTQLVTLVRIKDTKLEGETIERQDIAPYETERFKSHTTNEILWANRERDVIKHKLDHTVQRGTILTYSDFKPEKIRVKDGLAGIINPGERAVSIPVDSIASVTGLVKPGDSVDILGTFSFPSLKGDASMDLVTMTILQSVHILATGKEMATATQRFGRSNRQKGYSSVTLALTPSEVEMIVFAMQKGRLTLSLRSYQETSFKDDLPSVNFKYLEEKIPEMNLERKRRSNY